MSRTRQRRFLAESAAAGSAARLAAAAGGGDAAQRPNEYQLFFGDLHNHNNVGYAQGSLERTFEIAHNHLDFFAFTPHGWWPDIGHYENGIEQKWLEGFEVTQRRWPEVLAMVRKYDRPGCFVPISGYEWHSTALGDYHILFPTIKAEYASFSDLRQFQQFARRHKAILVPHHPANRRGHRGAAPAYWDPEVSPVLEIYSDWGNAEHDRAPYPYIRHTEGGRWTGNTLQQFLAQGHRVGVIAGTDDHLGYPGAYREGLAAVWATGLTREAIFDALRNRRVYAVTGDRIALDFRLNGRRMGQEMAYARQRALSVIVTGWDVIDRVEILKNNRVMHRQFPIDRTPGRDCWTKPVLLRFEYGWGPWPALDMARVCDWDISITLQGGRLEQVQTCFQSGPLDESRRDRILERSERHVRLQSFTALRQQFEDISTKGLVLRASGGPETRVTVSLAAPARVSLARTFAELAERNEMLFTGDFPKESAMLHRLVFHDHYHTTFSISDEDEAAGVDWYYLRVVQANGQLAWSSPIWVAASR